MASFNLTAELNLRGPSNLNQVVSNIRRQLSTVSLNLNINPATSRGIQAVTADVRTLSTALRDAQANAVALSTTLRGLGAATSNVARATSSLGSNLGSISGQASGTATAIKAASSEMTEFGRQSALAVRRFAAFSVATGAIYALSRAITSAYGEFVSFNKEFVRLQQVTDSTASGLTSLSNEITRLSTSLGVSSQELLQVSVTLAQAGLSAGETKTALEALAKSALAPSFDSLNDTVEGSIALMRQFGISAADLESSLGSVNAVAAKFAVEASDIIAAIQRTGGVFANASKGVSEGKDALNEFLAVFTSVRATTRESAETIATGLRTIFTRIQRTGTIDALKQYGISLTDLEGKFVGPYEAVRRLSEGLKALDPRDLRFSSIVEELGGFRQIGKVIPLIQQFETAQKALGVAQRGAGSLAVDAATAQEALSIRINKVREQFVALIRDIGQSQGFQTFVDISLKLAGALISVADAAKDVLPAIAAITAIRGVGSLGQFFGGFTGGLGRNKPRGFAKGGFVPGQGNRDTVPAMLTPGEFVIRKKAVEKIGAGNLGRINKYADGGIVQKFAGGDYVEGSAMKALKAMVREFLMPRSRKGGQRKISFMGQKAVALSKNIPPELLKQIEEEGRLVSGTGIGDLAKGDPGLVVDKIVNVALSKVKQRKVREGQLKKTQGALTFSAAGLKRGPRAPAGQMEKALARYEQDPEYRQAMGLETGIKGGFLKQFEAQAKAKIFTSPKSLLDKIPNAKARLEQFRGSLQQALKETSDPKDIKSINDQIKKANTAIKDIDDYMKGGFPANAGRASHFAWAMRQAIPESSMFANGGIVQRFSRGRGVKKISPELQKQAQEAGGFENLINQNMLGTDGMYNFGLVSLRSGTAKGSRIENRPIGKTGKRARIHVGNLSDRSKYDDIESDIVSSLQGVITQTGAELASSLGSSVVGGEQGKQILNGAVLSSATGSIFEAALQMVGSPYIDKIESIKSIDFPFGLGEASSLFGSMPPNVPTDATRTIGGTGKGISDFVGQISRFLGAIDKKEFTKNLGAPAPDIFRALSQGGFSGQKAQKLNNLLQGSGVMVSVGSKPLKAAGKSQLEKGLVGISPQLQQQILDEIASPYASGGSIQDTVPALLTPGEFVINKKAAQKIGSAKLNKLNKADKISGFNKGGPVGHVQRFAVGGSALPARPTTSTPFNMVVPPDTVSALQEIAKALENMGVSASESARILERGGAVSVNASERAYQADLNRLRIAGASASDIYDMEQRLAQVREQNATKIRTSDVFSGASGAQLQDIQTRAEAERERLINQRRTALGGMGLSAEEVEARMADPRAQERIRQRSFETASGAPAATLAAAGIRGGDIEQYINQSMMDTSTLRQMDQQLLETRRNQLRNDAAYTSASAAQQRRMMRELNARTNEELAARRDIVNQLRRDRGLSGGFLGREGAGLNRVLGAGQTGMALLGMGQLREDAFGQGQRGRRFATGFNRMSAGMQGAGMGLTFAGGMIGDTIGKAMGGKEGQALSSAVSAFVGSAGIGMMFGPIGALTGVVVGATTAIQAWKDSIVDATLQEEAEKIETATQKLQGSFEKLSKAKDPQEAQAALKSAASEFQKISTSESKRQSNIADKVLPEEPGFFGSMWRSLTGARGQGASWDPTGYSGTLLNPADLKMAQAEKEIVSSARQTNVLQSLPQQFELGIQKGLSLQQIQATFAPGELDKQKELFALASGDTVLTGLVAKRESMEKQRREGVQGIDTTAIDAAIKNLANRFFNQDFLKGLQDRIKSEQAIAAASAAAAVEIDLLNQVLTKIGSAASKAGAQFEEAQRQIAMQQSVMFGGGQIQGPDRSQENVLDNVLSYSFEEIRNVISRIGSEYQLNPAITREAQNSAVNQKILQQELPRILAEVTAREGEGFDPQGGSADVIRKKLEEVFSKFVPDAGRRKETIDRVVKNLTERLKNRQGTTVEDLAQDESVLADILKNAGVPLETFNSLLKQSNDVLAAVNAGMNEWVSNLSAATDMRIDAQNISIEAGNQLFKVLGEELSLGDMNQAFENTISTLTQRIGAGGAGVPGTGTLDPGTIMQRMLEREKDARDIQSQLDKEKPPVGSARFNELSESLKRAKLEASNLSRAHQKLQNDSSRASNALTKIGELKQVQDAKQSSLLDLLKNVNDPEAMMQFTNEVQSFFAQMAGQGSRENLPAAIAGLERQMAVLPAEQAQAIRDDFIKSLETTRGLDPNALATLKALIPNVTGVEVSPEMKGLIAEFYKYTDVQKEAIIQASNALVDGAKTAGNSLIAAGIKVQRTISAAGQDNPREVVPMRPQRRSKGGMIYASKGQYVNYQPRGTDTVPAMLTPGEFVVNAKATKKHMGLLQAINSNSKAGGYSKGGMVYLAGGGYVPKDTTIEADAAKIQSEMDAINAEIDRKLAEVDIVLQPLIEQQKSIPEGPQNDPQRRALWEQISPLYSQRDALYAKKAEVSAAFQPKWNEIDQRRSLEADRKTAATGELSVTQMQDLNAENIPGSTLGFRFLKPGYTEEQMTPEERKQYAEYKAEVEKRKQARIQLAKDRVSAADQKEAQQQPQMTQPVQQQQNAAQVQQQMQGSGMGITKDQRKKLNDERKAQVAAEKEKRRQAFLAANPYYKKKEDEKAAKQQQELQTAQQWYIKQNTSSDGRWVGHTDRSGKPGVPEDVVRQYKKNQAEQRKQESKERLLYGSTVHPLAPDAKERKEAAQLATKEQIAEQNKIRRGEELARRFQWTLPDTKPSGNVVGSYGGYERGEEPFELRQLSAEDRQALDDFQMSRLSAVEKAQREKTEAAAKTASAEKWEQTKTEIATTLEAERKTKEAEEQKAVAKREQEVRDFAEMRRQQQAQRDLDWTQKKESERTAAETEATARAEETKKRIQERRLATATNREEQESRIQDMVSSVNMPNVDEKKIKDLFDEPAIRTPDQKTNIPETTGLNVRIDPITGRPIDQNVDPRVLTSQLNETMSNLERLRQEQYWNNQTSSTIGMERLLQEEYDAAMADLERRKAAGEFKGKDGARTLEDARKKAMQSSRLGRFYSENGSVFSGPEDYAAKYVETLSKQEKEQLRKERSEQLVEREKTLKDQGRTTAVALSETKKAQAAALERKQASIANTEKEFQELKKKAARGRLSSWERDSLAEMAVERGDKARADVNLFPADLNAAEDNIRKRDLTEQEFLAARRREQKEYMEEVAKNRDEMAMRAFMPGSNLLQLSYLATGYGAGAAMGLDAQGRSEWGKTQTDESLSSGALGWTGAALDMAMPLGPLDDAAKMFGLGKAAGRLVGKQTPKVSLPKPLAGQLLPEQQIANIARAEALPSKIKPKPQVKPTPQNKPQTAQKPLRSADPIVDPKEDAIVADTIRRAIKEEGPGVAPPLSEPSSGLVADMAAQNRVVKAAQRGLEQTKRFEEMGMQTPDFSRVGDLPTTTGTQGRGFSSQLADYTTPEMVAAMSDDAADTVVRSRAASAGAAASKAAKSSATKSGGRMSPLLENIGTLGGTMPTIGPGPLLKKTGQFLYDSFPTVRSIGSGIGSLAQKAFGLGKTDIGQLGSKAFGRSKSKPTATPAAAASGARSTRAATPRPQVKPAQPAAPAVATKPAPAQPRPPVSATPPQASSAQEALSKAEKLKRLEDLKRSFPEGSSPTPRKLSESELTGQITRENKKLKRIADANFIYQEENLPAVLSEPATSVDDIIERFGGVERLSKSQLEQLEQLRGADPSVINAADLSARAWSSYDPKAKAGFWDWGRGNNPSNLADSMAKSRAGAKGMDVSLGEGLVKLEERIKRARQYPETIKALEETKRLKKELSELRSPKPTVEAPKASGTAKVTSEALEKAKKEAEGLRFRGNVSDEAYTPYLKEWDEMMDAGIPNEYRTYGAGSKSHYGGNDITGVSRKLEEVALSGFEARAKAGQTGSTKVGNSRKPDQYGMNAYMGDTVHDTGRASKSFGTVDLRLSKDTTQKMLQVYGDDPSGRRGAILYSIPLEQAEELGLADKLLEKGYSRFARGGIVYASKGTLVPYQPRGTDTVPAMLTPGEFVVNRKSAKQNMGLLKAINNGHNVKPLGFNKGGIVPTKYYETGGSVSAGSSGGGGVSSISVDASSLDAAFSNFNSYVSSLSSVIDGFTQGTTELAGLSQAIGSLGNLGLKEGASLMANAGISVKEATTAFSSAMTQFNTAASSLSTAISTIPKSIALTVSGSIPVTVSVTIEGGGGGAIDTAQLEQSIMDKVALAINSATQGGISVDTAIA